MTRVGFEPTTPVFEWAKIVHTWYRAATVIGLNYYCCPIENILTFLTHYNFYLTRI
jgi:hypothetical protein